MAVNLTASEVFTPITAISDALLGGGTGLDLGTVTNGNYAPLTDKTANTGHQDLYLSHDGTANISEFKCFIKSNNGFSPGPDMTKSNSG